MSVWDFGVVAVCVVAALVFHLVLRRKIRGWMTRDLINRLAGGDAAKVEVLEAAHTRLQSAGLRGDALVAKLEGIARGAS